MNMVLITAVTEVIEEFHDWQHSDLVIKNNLMDVLELLQLDARGIVCIGPDILAERGLTVLEPLIKQVAETEWRLVMLSADGTSSVTDRLYDLGVQDVLNWVAGSSHNIVNLHTALKRPFRKKLVPDHSEAAILLRSGIVSWVFDTRRWAFTFISRNIENVLGYPAENWYRRNYTFKLVHPDDRQRVDDGFRKAIAEGGIHEIRNRMLASGGRVVWIKTLINVEPRALVEESLLTGVMLDVSKDHVFIQDSIKRVERERSELEQHLDHAPLAVLKANENMEVSSWSPGAVAMFCRSEEEVMGKPWSELALIHPDEESRVIEELLPLINGQVRYQEVRNRNLRKDGSVVHMHWVNSCLRNPDGTLHSLLSMGRDVTAEIAVEQNRNQQAKMDALVALSTGIAHDFNNLLTPILLNAEIMEAGGVTPEKVKEKSALIKKSALRARDVISALIQLNRPMSPALTLINTSDFIAEIKQACSAVVSAANPLYLDYLNAPARFMGDETLLFQAVLNLVNNAVQAMAGQSGGIFLRVQHPADDNRLLLIAVKDEGPGIPLANQKDVFLPFFTTRRGSKGTGLGLAMVKRICEAHGGTVELESKPGQGSEFRLVLPFSVRLASATSLASDQRAAKALRIAVIDDEAPVLESTVNLLQSAGHSCTPFDSARNALIDIVNHPLKYNLIISDQIMPVQSGIELALSLEAAGIKTPLVLVTGTAAAVKKLDNLPANIKHVLEKPVTRGEVDACLHELFD